SLDGTDDDRTGVLAEMLPRFGGLFCVIDMANRNGVSLRTKPIDFVERQRRSGGDDEIIVSKAAAIVEFYRVLAWQHMLRPSGVEANFQFFADLGEVDLDVFRLPPIDRHPWIGGHEVKPLRIRQKGDIGLAADERAKLVSH